MRCRDNVKCRGVVWGVGTMSSVKVSCEGNADIGLYGERGGIPEDQEKHGIYNVTAPSISYKSYMIFIFLWYRVLLHQWLDLDTSVSSPRAEFNMF